MTMKRIPHAEYDSPWKEIIEQYFPDFMRFFFMQAYEEIDWKRKYTFLDQELQKIIPKSETGGRRVDKLVKLFLKNGKERWLLLHIEIQGQKDNDFEERVYIYNYRIFDRYKKPVISIAILTDDNPNWRPHSYHHELWGHKLSLDFLTKKLLDYDQEALAVNDNPFSIVVLAHLQTIQTRRSPEDRYTAKLKLAQLLYQRGYTYQEVWKLFRFIDWIMTLPDELDQQLTTELHKLQETNQMRYVTSIERSAMEKGWQEGLLDGETSGLQSGILGVLRTRFGNYLDDIMFRLQRINDTETLLQLNTQAVTVDSLDTFAELLPEIDKKVTSQ